MLDSFSPIIDCISDLLSSIFEEFSLLHTFPTRRSSDLITLRGSAWNRLDVIGTACSGTCVSRIRRFSSADWPSSPTPRSEEHTSELQSPCNIVCRLLLEKKKIKDNTRQMCVRLKADSKT